MGVQDAVLSLVVEQPDYGYRIAGRLEDHWSPAAVYKALRRLLDDGLIEPMEILEDIEGRPRKWYRATSQGSTMHREAVAKSIGALLGRNEVLERLEDSTPASAAAVIDEYERQVLKLLAAESSVHKSLIGRLVAQERRLVCEARLRWISIAREAIGNGPIA